MNQFKILISVFRLKRWYRNAFMLIGSLMALLLTHGTWDTAVLVSVAVSFVAVCLVASGNYGINEVFDAETDAHHPEKKFRALASGKVSKGTVIIISIVLYVVGLAIVGWLNKIYLLVSLAIFILTTGILYNIPPFRLKDIAYVDFLLESFGNPVRLAIGWYAVTAQIVPVSFIFIFWALGVLLMAGKRFAELRYLGVSAETHAYRKSLTHYTEEKLLLVMIAAAMVCMYMFGVLAVKHEIDLVILMPPAVIFLVWYFWLANRPNSIVKDPERIFENRGFVIYALILTAIFFVIFYFKFNYFSFLLR